MVYLQGMIEPLAFLLILASTSYLAFLLGRRIGTGEGYEEAQRALEEAEGKAMWHEALAPLRRLKAIKQMERGEEL